MQSMNSVQEIVASEGITHSATRCIHIAARKLNLFRSAWQVTALELRK
jgi:hypothetical protein